MQKYFIKAFTLVELIVVITILAILATIGFTSFIGYTLSSRESTRLSDVKLIEKQLSLYEVQNDTIPLPDNAVTITASGTTIGYQGEVGTGVLVSLRQAGDIKDPLDATRYSYFVDTARQNYQIMAMMENEASLQTAFIPESYANIDYSERFIKTFGDPIGSISVVSSNTPLNLSGFSGATFDVTNESLGYNFHFNQTVSLSNNLGAREAIVRGMSYGGTKSNCKSYIDYSNSFGDDGYYLLSDGNIVLCDMVTDGGGWININDNNSDASIVFDSENRLIGNNLRGGCSSRLRNFEITNQEYTDYSEIYLNLERVSTIIQCPRLRNLGDDNGIGGVSRVEYFDGTDWLKESSTACGWSPPWGISTNNTSIVGLPTEWKIIFRTTSMLDKSSYYFGSSCSPASDTGEYRVKLFVR